MSLAVVFLTQKYGLIAEMCRAEMQGSAEEDRGLVLNRPQLHARRTSRRAMSRKKRAQGKIGGGGYTFFIKAQLRGKHTYAPVLRWRGPGLSGLLNFENYLAN